MQCSAVRNAQNCCRCLLLGSTLPLFDDGDDNDDVDEDDQSQDVDSDDGPLV